MRDMLHHSFVQQNVFNIHGGNSCVLNWITVHEMSMVITLHWVENSYTVDHNYSVLWDGQMARGRYSNVHAGIAFSMTKYNQGRESLHIFHTQLDLWQSLLSCQLSSDRLSSYCVSGGANRAVLCQKSCTLDKNHLNSTLVLNGFK